MSSKDNPGVTPPPIAAAAKQRTIVAPWKCTEEFQHACHLIFGKNATSNQRRMGLSMIRIWKLRRGSLCPAAALATAMIVRAQLNDKKGELNLEKIYAHAIMRFFNFMSSTVQGHNWSSMYDKAQELGLPSFVVDIRHKCSHGTEMPPVDLLRTAADICLQWLHQNYWLPLKDTLCDLEAAKLEGKENIKFRQKMAHQLSAFDLALECQIKSAHSLKAIKKIKPKEFNKIRAYLSKNKLKTPTEILDMVINKLNELVKQASTVKNLPDVYVAEILRMKYFMGVGLNIEDNEEQIIAVTERLFSLIAVHGFTENIFVALVQLTENVHEPDERRLGARYWALKMIETFAMMSRIKRMFKEEQDKNDKLKPVDFSSLNRHILPKTIRTLIAHSGVDLSLTLMFGSSRKNPRAVLFDHEFFLKRFSYLSSFSAPILKALIPLAETPFDVDPMEQFDELYYPKVRPFTDLGIWTLAKDNNWSNCALGVLPSIVEKK
ncbi:uncharacterized protein LOC108153264 [Drosophila miranda]|uniref:uncharacterized protein LOC108153264 n=1 Tax=Drosophila miranda TaxID=7229 RepID=UPI0007E5BEBF|nr:uncharacterized protein LOC108153264 [Drosophila miranda]